MLSGEIRKIKEFLLYNSEVERLDRLWPADYKVFTTNPLNIAYGASGIIEFLLDVNTKKSDLNSYFEWILKHKIDNINYPPGLYVGSSGIAWVLSDAGFIKESLKIMDIANKSDLIYNNPDVFYGVSGIGMANLHFWYTYNDQKYLDMAYILGGYLVQNYHRIRELSFWNSKRNKIYLGYAHGSSGLALFLLYLYQAEKKEKYLDSAIKYLKFDLSNTVEEEGKIKMFSNINSRNAYFPYWEYGNAGLILVLLRFYNVLKDKKYKKLAVNSAKIIDVRLVSTAGLFLGLSSIGEAFIDMYQFLSDLKYKKIATEIANNVLIYSIEKENGVIYPGRSILRLSCDYGTGSAGVGIFLNRLLENKGRKFVNDYLLEEK